MANSELTNKLHELEKLHLGLCAKEEQLIRWGGLVLMQLEATEEFRKRVVLQIEGLAELEEQELPVFNGSSLGVVKPLDDTERESILAALHQTGGNRSQAAKQLGLSRRAFLRRAEKHDIPKGKKYGKREAIV